MSGNQLSISAIALNTYQDQIDMISNNLANAGTTGYKDQTLNFQDQYYQVLAEPTAPTTANGGTDPIDAGLGVKIGSRETDFTQGSLQTTGTNTDLAISGDGFFILGTANGSSAPTYTRNGAFTLNQNGVLIDPSSGEAVLGYTANSAGVLPGAGSTPATITIPVGLTTSAVGTGFGAKTGPSSSDLVYDMVQGGNLNQSSWQTVAQGGTAVPQSVSTTIYDSLGGAHQATITYTPYYDNADFPGVGLPATVQNSANQAIKPATAWQVSVQFSDGTAINGGAANASAVIGYAFFDQNGQYINSSGQANPAVNSLADVHTLGKQPSAIAGNLLNITSWGVGNNATAPTGTPANGAIGISYSDLTSLAGTSQPVVTVSQNGYSAGTLQNFSIGQDGSITGSYSNGQQKVLAQVALATFENEQGLQQQGGSQYAPTASSGTPQIGLANQGRYGAIIAGSLEQSNVSIATEFTKLIVAQNAFLSNSKAITIGNQDLQAIDQLIA